MKVLRHTLCKYIYYKRLENRNIGEKALIKHEDSKAHTAAQERYNGFVNLNAAIQNHIEQGSDDLRLYENILT
jgi:hypothetical protein